jgi:hypothetical protein
MMKAFAFAVLLSLSASAATLEVTVDRNAFTGPIELAVAPRVDGQPPKWSSSKTLRGEASSARFDVEPGLYVVLASGPKPLQRLSARANVGTDGATIRLTIPKDKTELRTTLGGEPLAGAEVVLTHRQLQWHTDIETGDDGRFAGELWEPALYMAGVRRDPTTSAHHVEVWLSDKPVTIDVPDRHVSGRILAGGKPLAGALLLLRSENSQSTLTVRTQSAPDGRFEFFGVREGELTLTARALSHLDSDPINFELHGPHARHSVDVDLQRGQPRAVRIVDARGNAISGATLITSCEGHVKSTTVTNAAGAADVALRGDGASCAIYVLPQEGSIAIAEVEGSGPLVIRVPDGTSSLRLALKSDAGDAFSSMSLLMRIDGIVVPPAVARLVGSRGFPLVTNDDGSISLPRIPPGTYEFWPYRDSAEGQMLYEAAKEFAAPISVKVQAGENNATVRFKAR